MPVKVFWCDWTGRSWRSLRRYTSREYVSGERLDWTCAAGWHNASTRIEDLEGEATSGDNWPHDDPRWPVECETGCGYRFTETDAWQMFANHEYAGGDQTFVLHKPPPGAMWNADWMPEGWRGADGMSLAVVLPNSNVWLVDARASNCTLPDDKVHKCWVRHGDPRTGEVHVDKDGVTCAAGAGSIMSGNYHGFLHNGFLTD